MADFSLTTLFVVPVSQSSMPSAGSSTQDLTAGQVGVFLNTHAVATAGNIAAAPYFYIAQGRDNTFILGSKKSDKIKGCDASYPCKGNVVEWYSVNGCPTPVNQIMTIGGWHIQCGEDVTVTLRAHSNYIDTLYFNGFTRSVTVKAPCCDCPTDPCTDVDVDALIDLIMTKLTGYTTTSGVTDWTNPVSDVEVGIAPENISLNTFFTFTKIGSGANASIQIEGKALTAYGQPCDIAAFPHQYDRMWFNAWAYEGPATTADFIVSDACNIVAISTITQKSTYATGTSEEIKQLEKNYYSYQAGYFKHLYRMAGYNQNFESWVTDGTVYNTYYIKCVPFERRSMTWGDYVPEDFMVIIAVEAGSDAEASLVAILEAALGKVTSDNACVTTTSTTTVAPTTTTTTTAAITTTTTTVAPTTTTTTTIQP